MKKIFILSLMAVALMATQSFAETRQTILLLHDGTGRNFDPDQLQEAVNAAVAGDTLYLNEGIYPLTGDTLTIDKSVSIIGLGVKTRLLGCINVAIPDSVTLKQHLLDALRLTKDLVVTKPVNGPKFRKVQFDASLVWNATVRDMEADRCYIRLIWHSPLLKSANIVNCKVDEERVTAKGNLGNSPVFINCAIRTVYHEGGHTTSNNYSEYTNCIIHNAGGGTWEASHYNRKYVVNTSMFNSLVHYKYTIYDGPITQENCYDLEIEPLFDWAKDNTCTLTDDKLIEHGCVGTDGTVVGCTGGQAPYTLIPNGISVKQSTLSIDGDKRTLNVTLKLQAK